MKKTARVYALATAASLMAAIILIFPEQSFEAALQGVHTWFEVVFPSLLPFFIGAELLISIGVVNFIGVMLEPIMRPLFNTPGCSSFAYIMSITSGYPTGARITARLRQQGLITKAEGERMLTFCSTSGPLFITGAVAVGMLGYPPAGWVILLSHYLASITSGILFRFYKYHYGHAKQSNQSSHILSRALSELYEAYTSSKMPLGQRLGQAVNSSISSLLNICGFIVLFSVIINILNFTGIFDALAALLGPSVPAKPFLAGLVEITIGSKMLSQMPISIWNKLPLISFVITWGGLSVHAQVAAVTAGTDLSLVPYFSSKIIQAVAAAIYSSMLIRLIQPAYKAVFTGSVSVITVMAQSGQLFILAFLIISAISILMAAINRIKIIKL